MAKAYSITSKFQVTLPETVRNKLRLDSHDKVEFSVVNGRVVIEKAMSLDDLQTKLHKKFLASKRAPATDSEIKNARQAFDQKGLRW